MNVPSVTVHPERDNSTDSTSDPANVLKMRIKRALIFLILLTASGSIYYFYSLHTSQSLTNDSNKEDVQQMNIPFPQGKRVAVNFREPARDSIRGKAGDDAGDQSREADQPVNKKIQLFPNGVRVGDQVKVDKKDEEEEEQPMPFYRDDFHAGGDDNGDQRDADDEAGQNDQADVEEQLRRQQELIEQQAKVLQQLQEQLLEGQLRLAPKESQDTDNGDVTEVPFEGLDFPDNGEGGVQDDVQNFKGQIKGAFQGMVLNDNENQVNINKPAGAQVPVQNRAWPRPLQSGMKNERKPIADAAQMFADVRRKAELEELKGQQELLQNDDQQAGWHNRQPARPARPAKNVTDARKMFEDAIQKNKQLPIPVLQNQIIPAQEVAGDADLFQRGNPINENQDRALANPRDSAPVSQETFSVSLPPLLDEQNNDIDDNMKVKRIEQAIHREGDDQLLEDRFRAVKDEVEALPAGKEPELNIEKDDIKGSKRAKVDVYDLEKPTEGTFECVALRLKMFSRTVCIHSHSTDPVMSEQLIQKGTWEEDELDDFQAALATDSSLAALDLGAGIGVYTIAAAALGRRVLAVEPLESSIRLFHRTVQLNSAVPKVTLVTNALGTTEGFGRIVYPNPVGHMGAVYVKPVRLLDIGNNLKDLVRIVTLDDLLPLTSFTKAVMKLDVQGDEHNVLAGGTEFFTRIDVKYVFMHWLPTQNPRVFSAAGDFLKQHGYEAALKMTGRALTDRELRGDVNYVVWRKKASM